MPQLPADVRISRHIERLLTYGSVSKVEQVLEKCGLERDRTSVHSRDGFVTDDDCYSYKQAVKEVFGDTAYSFAKINFVLAGCKCRDCE